MASARAAILGTLPDATAGVSVVLLEEKSTKRNSTGLHVNVMFSLQSAHVTSWALNAASAWSERTVCASVPQGNASVYRTS